MGERIDDTVGDNKNYKRVAITKKLLSMLEKRFFVAVHLFSNRSQMRSKVT